MTTNQSINDAYASTIQCDRCKKIIPRQWIAQSEIDAKEIDASLQLDNNLVLELFGGYGMFIDPFPRGSINLCICHECAHELFDFLGLDASFWHSHRQGQDHHSVVGNH